MLVLNLASLLALSPTIYAWQSKTEDAGSETKFCTSAQLAADPAQDPFTTTANVCPSTGGISCGIYQQNACCVEANGRFMQTQSWNFNPAVGEADSWGIHGLWPDCCPKPANFVGHWQEFPQNCDPSRNRTGPLIEAIIHEQIPELLPLMNRYWQSIWKAEPAKPSHGGSFKAGLGLLQRLHRRHGHSKWHPFSWIPHLDGDNEGPPPMDPLNHTDPLGVNGLDAKFWEHEWAKHGTCVTTLGPSCPGMGDQQQDGADIVAFFNTTVHLFLRLPTYDWLAEKGITPGASYSTEQISSVLRPKFGAIPALECDNQNRLNQIDYYHLAVGSIKYGNFKPIDPSSDPIEFQPTAAERKRLHSPLCARDSPVWYCQKGDITCGEQRSDEL